MTNARDAISTAIGGFLSLIQPDQQAGKPTLAQLALALDQLVGTYYSTPDVGPDASDSAGPRTDEKLFEEGAAAAFPELGWYAIVDPEGDTCQQIGLGIASSDLAEIALDLNEVLWLFENASENDAIWQYRWGYQNHWGRHVHELRLYLHIMGAW